MTPWHHSSNVLIELVRYGAWVLEFLASSQVWSGVRKALKAPGRCTHYLHTLCLTDWESSLELCLCCARPEKQFHVLSAGGHIVILLLALGVPQLDLEIVGICAPFLPRPRNSKSGRTASLALKSWFLQELWGWLWVSLHPPWPPGLWPSHTVGFNKNHPVAVK